MEKSKTGSLQHFDFCVFLTGATIEQGSSTPLMEAAQEGHVDLVKFLLEQGTCDLDSAYFFRVGMCALILLVMFIKKTKGGINTLS